MARVVVLPRRSYRFVPTQTPSFGRWLREFIVCGRRRVNQFLQERRPERFSEHLEFARHDKRKCRKSLGIKTRRVNTRRRVLCHSLCFLIKKALSGFGFWPKDSSAVQLSEPIAQYKGEEG